MAAQVRRANFDREFGSLSDQSAGFNVNLQGRSGTFAVKHGS